MKNCKLLPLPILALILELLPYGAVLIFCPSPTERVPHAFSYFDLIPFGYAHFAYLITGVLTIVLLLLAACEFVLRAGRLEVDLTKLRRIIWGISVAAAVCSLCPLLEVVVLTLLWQLEPATQYNGVSAAITLLLAAEGLLAWRSVKEACAKDQRSCS